MIYQKLDCRPGNVTFTITPDGSFQTSDWLCLDLCANGGNDLLLCLEFSESKDTPALIKMTQHLIPGIRAVLPFPIDKQAMKLEKLFLVPRSALRKGSIGGMPTEKKKIGCIRLSISSSELGEVELFSADCRTECPKAPLAGKKLVDRFGQGIIGQTTDRVTDENELVDALRAELEAIENSPADYPKGFSKWGGWTEKRFDATGFFRLERENDKWWLVDPDGYAFFSNGVCYGERVGVFGITDEYSPLFEWLPDEQGEFADAWCTAENIPQYIVRNGRKDADKRKLFNFARANLIRAFGMGWHDAYTRITASRLKKMGFNTIGVGTNDYFDEQTDEFLRGAKIPYIVTFRDFPTTKEMIFRDFPDVFSEEYRTLCREFAVRSLGKYIGDPYMIGYFVTNEPVWFFASGINLTERLLAGEGCEASKSRFIEFAKEKYGSVDRLNSAWNTSLGNFEELLKPHVFVTNPAVEEDFKAFEKLLVNAYEKVVSDALRDVDPDHLNLGMRYAGVSDRILSFDHADFDIFSFNCYSDSPIRAVQMCAKLDKPLIVGEWHIGARESLLPAFGLRYTDTQSERAAACRYYSEQGAAESSLVGMHYFEYNDQPYFGRFDGECYQIGLQDVCQRPYREVCEMFEDFSKHFYLLHDKKEAPTAAHIETKCR